MDRAASLRRQSNSVVCCVLCESTQKLEMLVRLEKCRKEEEEEWREMPLPKNLQPHLPCSSPGQIKCVFVAQ